MLTLTAENLTFNETGHTAPGRESAQLILVNPEGRFASYEEYRCVLCVRAPSYARGVGPEFPC